jgi:hypothetical protein
MAWSTVYVGKCGGFRFRVMLLRSMPAPLVSVARTTLATGVRKCSNLALIPTTFDDNNLPYESSGCVFTFDPYRQRVLYNARESELGDKGCCIHALALGGRPIKDFIPFEEYLELEGEGEVASDEDKVWEDGVILETVRVTRSFIVLVFTSSSDVKRARDDAVVFDAVTGERLAALRFVDPARMRTFTVVETLDLSDPHHFANVRFVEDVGGVGVRVPKPHTRV